MKPKRELGRRLCKDRTCAWVNMASLLAGISATAFNLRELRFNTAGRAMFCLAKLPFEDGKQASVIVWILRLELFERVFFGCHDSPLMQACIFNQCLQFAETSEIMQALFFERMLAMTTEPKGKAKGGIERARSLTPEARTKIASNAAKARWGPKATHTGNFKDDFGIDVECYVLDDAQKTAVISQRGLAVALGFSPLGGNRLPRFLGGKSIAPYLGLELKEKLNNPLIFQGVGTGSGVKIHGSDVTVLIDLCKAIVAAEAAGELQPRQAGIAKQAHIILNASAKAGIKGLVYALAGFRPETEEVIAAFKLFVQEEAKKYEKEFPNELYLQWHRLYQIPVPVRGKPWQLRHLTVKHIYYPLAKSNGKIFELVKALKAKDGDRNTKLFQFLNEIGARALRIQLGRVLEMAESSATLAEYQQKTIDRFGGQTELALVMPDDSAKN
jgi:hypothetical protein